MAAGVALGPPNFAALEVNFSDKGGLVERQVADRGDWIFEKLRELILLAGWYLPKKSLPKSSQKSSQKSECFCIKKNVDI